METLKPARADELDICYEMIDAGRRFQREQGFMQWTDDYPNRETILDDIRARKGYVLKTEDGVAGYMCIDFGTEPAYNEIEGEWHTKGPYAVVHRMAFNENFRGRGLSRAAFRLIEELCLAKDVRGIRVDTDFPNKRMQHILAKNGFSPCGTVVFQGSPKLAYDKILSGEGKDRP